MSRHVQSLWVGWLTAACLVMAGCGDKPEDPSSSTLSPKTPSRPLGVLAATAERQLQTDLPAISRCITERQPCARIIARAGGLINQLQVLDLTFDELHVAKGACRSALARERPLLEQQLTLLERILSAQGDELSRLQNNFTRAVPEHQARLGAVSRSCRDIRVPGVPLI